MEWFTRDWHYGRLSDAEWERRAQSYDRHAAVLRSELPPDQQWLVGMDLHDAQVQSWHVGPDEFHWELLTGDLQRGYRITSVTYFLAGLVGATAADLDDWRLTERGELLSDEVAKVSNGLEHRFIFDVGSEFGVRFNHASVRYQAADAALRR